MQAYETLRHFEELNEQDQIEEIENRLIDVGFSVSSPVKGRKGKAVLYYYKDECDVVLAVIKNSPVTGKNDYIFIDKEMYISKFAGTNRTLSHQKKDKQLQILVRGSEKGGEEEKDHNPLHHFVVEKEFRRRQQEQKLLGDRRQIDVDHIYNNYRINTMKELRVCLNEENKMNRRDFEYSKVRDDGYSFYAPSVGIDEEDREQYIKSGYYFMMDVEKGECIISPQFETSKELYEAMGDFEAKYQNEFRYNPLRDFSETWYVFAFWKMLKGVTDEDVNDYQADYFWRKAENTKENKRGISVLQRIVWKYRLEPYCER